MTTSLNYMSSSVVRIHSTYNINIAGWTSSASYWVHTPESVGSNPTPATIYFFTSAWEIRAGFLNFYILAIYSLFFRGDNMSVQEIIDLLSDSVSEGKLNRNSQVTVMEYDHKGDGLKRIDLNHFKIEDKKITFSSFLY